MDGDLVKQITEIVIYRLNNQIPIGVSARHVHLSREDADALFGPGYQLRKKKELMGGQYACEESLTLVGTKLRAIENVRILGPLRKRSQVEVAKTDAIRLGINPPIRESGQLTGSAPIALIGPKGAVYLNEGCIIARRHIHMPPGQAAMFGLKDGDTVEIKALSARGGIFSDVQIRVDDTFTLEMHIDTDEGNALGINCGEMGLVI